MCVTVCVVCESIGLSEYEEEGGRKGGRGRGMEREIREERDGGERDA